MIGLSENRREKWSDEKIVTLLQTDGSWLCSVSTSVILEIANAGTTKSLPTGTVVASQHESLTETMIVLQGMQQVYSISLDGHEHLGSLLETGSIFGMISCLDRGLKPHEVAAGIDTVALVVNQKELQRLMNYNTKI